MSKKDNPYSHLLSRVYMYTAGLTDQSRAGILEDRLEYWHDSEAVLTCGFRNNFFLRCLREALDHHWIIPYRQPVFTPTEQTQIHEFARSVLSQMCTEQEKEE